MGAIASLSLSLSVSLSGPTTLKPKPKLPKGWPPGPGVGVNPFKTYIAGVKAGHVDKVAESIKRAGGHVDKTFGDNIVFQFPVRRIKEIEALPFVKHVEEDRIVSVLPTFATYTASIKEGSSERDTTKRLDVVDAAITSAGGTVKSIKYLERKIIFEFQTGRVKEIE